MYRSQRLYDIRSLIKLCMSTGTTAITGIFWQEFSHWIIYIFLYIYNLYLAGKTPLLIGDMQVNLVDILPETSKSSACWDVDGNSNLLSYGCPVTFSICPSG